MTKMTMEKLLQWAFVHELPKGGGADGLVGGGSAWSAITGYGQLGTLVDTSRHGDWRPPFILEQGEPDADAVAIGRAVAELGVMAEIVIPAEWNPLGDWQDADARRLGLARADEVAQRIRLKGARAVREAVSMIVAHAVMGTRPDWRLEEPRTRFCLRGGKPAWFVRQAMTDAFGRTFEIEANGMNPKTRRPLPGAYRKTELTEDPAGGILSRLDWQVWTSALAILQDCLDGVLARRTVARVKLAANPWGGPYCPPAALVLGMEKGAVAPKRVA